MDRQNRGFVNWEDAVLRRRWFCLAPIMSTGCVGLTLQDSGFTDCGEVVLRPRSFGHTPIKSPAFVSTARQDSDSEYQRGIVLWFGWQAENTGIYLGNHDTAKSHPSTTRPSYILLLASAVSSVTHTTGLVLPETMQCPTRLENS